MIWGKSYSFISNLLPQILGRIVDRHDMGKILQLHQQSATSNLGRLL
jgi:hypothetical protein